MNRLAAAVAALLLLGAGRTAALAQAAPAAPAAATGAPAYRIVADSVVAQSTVQPGGVSVNQDVFFPGDLIVFRAVIADGVAGVPLDQAAITLRGVKVAVALKDGTVIPVRYGVHPPPNIAPKGILYWTGALLVKPDRPTGSYPWTMTVSDAAGHTTTFTPIGQEAGLAVLTVAAKAAAAPKTGK